MQKAHKFKNIQEVPSWVWQTISPNFNPRSDPMLACPETRQFNLHIPSLQALQGLRDYMGGPLRLLSGYRSPIYNAKVGGVPLSMHKELIAWDITFGNYDPQAMYLAARKQGFTGFGIYLDRKFIHVDMGRPRMWWGNPSDRDRWKQMQTSYQLG